MPITASIENGEIVDGTINRTTVVHRILSARRKKPYRIPQIQVVGIIITKPMAATIGM
jgi:hypothetical protein